MILKLQILDIACMYQHLKFPFTLNYYEKSLFKPYGAEAQFSSHSKICGKLTLYKPFSWIVSSSSSPPLIDFAYKEKPIHSLKVTPYWLQLRSFKVGLNLLRFWLVQKYNKTKLYPLVEKKQTTTTLTKRNISSVIWILQLRKDTIWNRYHHVLNSVKIVHWIQKQIKQTNKM